MAWTSDGHNVMLQKLDANGNPQWIRTTAFNYSIPVASPTSRLARPTCTRTTARSSSRGAARSSLQEQTTSSTPIRASTGRLLWGVGEAREGTRWGLAQFSEVTVLRSHRRRGQAACFRGTAAVPACKFMRTTLCNRTEAFGHNALGGSTNVLNVRVSPSVSYNPATQETFLFFQQKEVPTPGRKWGLGQKFNSSGARQWTDSGLTVVSRLGSTESSWRTCRLNGSAGFLGSINPLRIGVSSRQSNLLGTARRVLAHSSRSRRPLRQVEIGGRHRVIRVIGETGARNGKQYLHPERQIRIARWGSKTGCGTE